MTERIRVAVADDHVLFCSGLEMLIGASSDLEYAGAAYDGEQAVRLCREERPQIILMDVRMPRLDGVSATRRIVSEPDNVTRVIVLTTHQDDEAVAAALRAGASGFLMKDATPDLLLGTIRAVAAGRTVVTATGLRPPLHDFADRTGAAPPARTVLEVLSDREREIFAHAAGGLSIADIAGIAHLSESTVKTHVSAILAKLGLSSRLQLVAFAHTNGLV